MAQSSELAPAAAPRPLQVPARRARRALKRCAVACKKQLIKKQLAAAPRFVPCGSTREGASQRRGGAQLRLAAACLRQLLLAEGLAPPAFAEQVRPSRAPGAPPARRPRRAHAWRQNGFVLRLNLVVPVTLLLLKSF
jgi:hypothetical protein